VKLKHAFLTASIVAAAAIDLSAQSPSLTFAPASPAPGAIVRITLSVNASSDDTVARISGTMSGEPLHFTKSGVGTWRAIGPVSADASGDVEAKVLIERASGTLDSARGSVSIPKPPPRRPGRARTLSVAPRFTQPLDAETQARIERENATAREIGRRAHDTAPMWTEPFMRPRAATVTSRFGTGRMFNGTMSSRHLGVDFRGGVGSPVLAANRGVVALVGDFFLAGNVVYVDHGGGVVTAYFHLSRTLVAAGDTVRRGQEIGLVGDTGRVTGPHLHWSARYGTVTVNPLDLISVGVP
jgi:murein DD-endopeptidase MepM/ murein hydrolase activator NlpD